MDEGFGRAAIRVTAPARLHLGFLDLDGGLGRRYGSLGVAIEEIATIVRLSRASATLVVGPEAERAALALARAREHLEFDDPVRLEVLRAIPAHAGLGSGTQLALAIAAGLAALSGRSADAADLSRALGSGARSGIGIGAFARGGFVIDGGRRLGEAEDGAPPIIARLAVPSDWRLLLIFDPAREGLHGEAERRAFATPPPFGADRAGRLCRDALMRLLPGLACADFDAVSRSLGAIQREVGDYFRFAQGDRFASPEVAAALAFCLDRSIRGVGQSSWGPTGFALLPSPDAAEALAGAARAAFPALRFQIVAARDRGHDIS